MRLEFSFNRRAMLGSKVEVWDRSSAEFVLLQVPGSTFISFWRHWGMRDSSLLHVVKPGNCFVSSLILTETPSSSLLHIAQLFIAFPFGAIRNLGPNLLHTVLMSKVYCWWLTLGLWLWSGPFSFPSFCWALLSRSAVVTLQTGRNNQPPRLLDVYQIPVAFLLIGTVPCVPECCTFQNCKEELVSLWSWLIPPHHNEKCSEFNNTLK